jgi:hypothetical protein
MRWDGFLSFSSAKAGVANPAIKGSKNTAIKIMRVPKCLAKL